MGHNTCGVEDIALKLLSTDPKPMPHSLSFSGSVMLFVGRRFNTESYLHFGGLSLQDLLAGDFRVHCFWQTVQCHTIPAFFESLSAMPAYVRFEAHRRCKLSDATLHPQADEP